MLFMLWTFVKMHALFCLIFDVRKMSQAYVTEKWLVVNKNSFQFEVGNFLKKFTRRRRNSILYSFLEDNVKSCTINSFTDLFVKCIMKFV